MVWIRKITSSVAREKPYYEEEIKNSIMGSYSNGASRPDGLSFIFYQIFCDIIKKDLIALVRDFENGALDISRLNYAIINLIPK